jgi:hypothetical protein
MSSLLCSKKKRPQTPTVQPETHNNSSSGSRSTRSIADGCCSSGPRLVCPTAAAGQTWQPLPLFFPGLHTKINDVSRVPFFPFSLPVFQCEAFLGGKTFFFYNFFSNVIEFNVARILKNCLNLFP